MGRVFFAGHGASATRHVEVSTTCTTLRNRNQGRGCNGGCTALGRRTRTTITTPPTHPTPTNFPPRLKTLYMYKRRLATSTRRNKMTKALWRYPWGESVTYIPSLVRDFLRRRRGSMPCHPYLPFNQKNIQSQLHRPSSRLRRAM